VVWDHALCAAVRHTATAQQVIVGLCMCFLLLANRLEHQLERLV
jgi:hypothetical protein